MKRLLIIAGLALSLIILSATPVYAYTPPGQSSENATDVILWHGDNVTIEKATLDGTVEVSGLSDIADDYLSFLIVAFVIVLALKYGSTILTALCVPVSMVYGFTMASNQDVYSPLWVSGVAVGILGLYFMFKLAWEGISRMRRKRAE